MKQHTTHFNGCDCVMKELDELRKDKDRLDWMIENVEWIVNKDDETCLQVKLLKNANLSCDRMVLSSIDAAMESK